MKDTKPNNIALESISLKATKAYRRFRQWQQKGPRYVNKHLGTVLRCANCGAEVAALPFSEK